MWSDEELAVCTSASRAAVILGVDIERAACCSCLAAGERRYRIRLLAVGRCPNAESGRKRCPSSAALGLPPLKE